MTHLRDMSDLRAVTGLTWILLASDNTRKRCGDACYEKVNELAGVREITCNWMRLTRMSVERE